MPTKSLLSLAVATFLLFAFPARSQMPPPAAQMPPVQLPDGNGKDQVQKLCTTCHGLNMLAFGGHTREGWDDVLYMMTNLGAQLPRDQFPMLDDYLAKNFPEKPMPPAVVVPGSVQVSIEEWPVPTKGSRPHDPLVAPDGSIWYTGQMANVLGRFDPKTKQFKEYRLKTPGSGPHGLVADKDGNIWFTANFKAYIGKLDPKTGDVTEYPMPDPAARDPHTLIFDQKGTIWFTAQGADMVGKLTPKTGEIKLVHVPTPRANPYGMVVNSKGVPFFVEFGSYKVASIDPETMEIHEYVLPHQDSRPRRVAITPDDVIWYSDYGRGYLGRLDPKTGEPKEWPSPGGPKSQPYGITAIKNIIWYSESGVKPNTMVRFDPATEKFQTWVIPSGGGVVRNMMATKDGDIWLACSGVNGIGVVHVKGSSKTGQGN